MKNSKQKLNLFRLSKVLVILILLSNGGWLLAQNLPEPPELIPYRKGDKWGYCDRNKKIVIECKYDFAESFNNNVAKVKMNNEFFFINKNGEKVLPPTEVRENVNIPVTLVVFKENDLFGYKDKEGNVVIKPQYQSAGDFSNGLAPVKKNNLWGYIDMKGNVIVPFKYDDAMNFENGIGLIGIDGNLGYIDAKGNEYWEDFKSSKIDNETWIKKGVKLNYTINYVNHISFELKEVSDKIHFSWYKNNTNKGEVIITNEALKNSFNQYNYIYGDQKSQEPLILNDGTSVFCSRKMLKELKKNKKIIFYPYIGISPKSVELIYKGQKKVNIKYNNDVITLNCILSESQTGERLVILDNPQYPLIVDMVLTFKIHLKHIEDLK